MLNILVASKNRTPPQGLEHLPEHRLIFSTAFPWGRAANELLGDALGAGGDALFCDDDVTFTEESMQGVREYYSFADAFGFDLHTMDGERQAGARHTLEISSSYNTGVPNHIPAASLPEWNHPGPAYVAHVSTSAIYLKESALRSGARFPEWPGMHFEDVVYCFDLWLKDCKVMAVPGYVHHNILGGVGATKRNDPTFWPRWAQNRQAFYEWAESRDLLKIPSGVVPFVSGALSESGVML